MMKFRVISKAIIELLGNSAFGRFTVTGYEGQTRGAAESKGKKRNVQVFFNQGDFPKNSGRAYGATDHQMTFTVGFTVSAAASCNLAVINADPPAPAPAITAALASMQDASKVAGDLMDELFELVYQILMDGQNIDLGLPVGTVTDRWVTTLKKDNPLPRGALLVLTGEAQYTCRTVEDITGDVPVLATEGIENSLYPMGDEAQAIVLRIRHTFESQYRYNDGSSVIYNDGTPV